ncbi:mucin-2-like [Ylistrum balloti]|uniref:mucin-2-like n=1 Tax=Ylistrum balloti TaxID=509963 RepID=UPI002905F388|nr:mucin-2-like [Ylistrum balloti]
MSTQEPKPEAFNPLDILATAAALKQVDKGQGDKGHVDKGQGHTMTQSSPSNSEDNVTDNNADAKTSSENSKNGNNGVHMRKIRVLKITSDIEKMLDEHNYGNSRKNYGKPSGSWPETSVKDRKVIVTVVNGTGDHTVVKPIDSVDVGPSGDGVRASGDRKMDNEGDQVNHTSDTGNLPEAGQDNKAEGIETHEISSVSGDHSVSTEINDNSTESSSDSTSCTCTDKTQCSCVNKNIHINTSPCLGDDTSCITLSKPAVGQECSCVKSNNEKASETEPESPSHCAVIDNQPGCDNKQVEPISVNNSGVSNCDTGSQGDATTDLTACQLEVNSTSNTLVNLGASKTKSHIRMVSHTMPNPETKLRQPQTLVININHNKQTAQSDIGYLSSKADDSLVTSSLSNSKDLCVETSDNCPGESGSDKLKDHDEMKDICSADFQTASVSPVQTSAGQVSMSQSTFVEQDQVLESDMVAKYSSVAQEGESCDDNVICEKEIPQIGDDKLCCKKPIASTSSLENASSPELVDIPEQASEKMFEEELFKESNDSSAFDDPAFSNSSSKIFLKTQPCLETHQISSCLKPLVQSGRSDETSSPASADHCYAGLSENVTEPKPVRKSIRLQSADSLVSDLSQDSGFVEVSPGTPSGNKMFPNRLSDTPVDQKMDSGSSDSSPENVEIKDIKNFLVTSSSASILSQDLSDVNKTRDAIIALMQQSSSDNGVTNLHPVPVTPIKSNKVSIPNKNVSPKVGKYRIGTFGSVSNSAMGLESPKKRQSAQVITAKQSSKDLANCTKSLLGKINASGRSMMPCIVTSANNGPQVTIQDSSVSVESLDIWKGHVEHDHDYCLPPEAESSSPHLMAKLLKDTSMKNVLKCGGRDKRTESSESNGSTSKRPRRVSLSGRPDLPRSSSAELSSPSSLSSSPVDFPVVQPHMTARQRAKAEKAAEYVKMGNSDSKLKITGKFQDDYIYFLNTKVRSRRRTNSQDLPPQLPPDRIVVPTPKPGDIVVPHLTDADLEAIRLGKHASIKSAASSSGLGGLPVSASSSQSLKQIQSSPSIMVTAPPVSETTKSSVSSTGPMSDEESKIINTILSMETGESTSTTSSSSIVPDVGTEVPSLSLPNSDSFNFLPEQMNLTPEQYEILYSAMDEVQGFDDLDCGPSSPTSQSEISEDTTTPTEPMCPQSRPTQVLAANPEHSLQGGLDTSTLPNQGQKVPMKCSTTVDNPVPSTSQTDSLEPACESQPKVVVPNLVSEPPSQNLVKCEDKPLTVKTLLQANGAAKSLLQSGNTSERSRTGQHSTLTNMGPATTVQSLLKTDQSKSLLTSDIPGPSSVSSIQDLAFTSLDKSSTQDLPFTSLEKSSLDLFENDLKLFPDSTVPDNSSPSTIPPTVSPAPPATDYSAPWIVTVSMFWNDLPAIMIDNLPFVRLVDIHKQILPAKDTGILKKRCQLLGIYVGNCSEMQRYFLVQYGKAFNSKSTLIVGKNDAKMLIGYYVNPVPKTSRGEESLVGRSVEDRVGPSRFSKVRGGAKVKDHIAEPRVLEVLPILSDPVSAPEENDIPVRPLPLQDVTATRTAVSASSTADSVSASQPGRVSHRTRHKKINFLEMLKGDANNNTSLVDNVTPQGSLPGSEESVCEGTSPSNATPSEESINKEKIAKKNVNVKNMKISSGKVKNKMVVNRDRVKVKKGKEPVSEEQSMGESECENRVEEEEEEVVEGLREKLPFFIGKRGAKDNDREQMAKKLKIMKSRKPGALKVKWKIFGKSNNAKRVVFNKGNNNKTESRAEILAVIHKDMVPRNGHKHRMQAGNVFLDQYNRKDSTCIRCCTCKKLLSVDMFLIHLHEIGGSGKLLSVSQPQVISLRDSYPSETQKRLWENFQKRRRLHSSNSERSRNSAVESVDQVQQEILPVPSKKVEQRKKVVSERLANPAKVTIRHSSVPAIQAPVTLSNGNVRISARKRKQKQLYPIENYSFSRKGHQKNLPIDSDGDEPLSPNGLEVNVDEGGSPTKITRLLPPVLENGTSVGVERVVPTVSQGSVLTLANGPEVISFTALQEDEAMDME